ncbi:MAG: hypothetical protein HFF06_02005 [Oscillospiraceae bacterium]|nr:hypothetical protein [Oscillospiraceae bacterium]
MSVFAFNVGMAANVLIVSVGGGVENFLCTNSPCISSITLASVPQQLTLPLSLLGISLSSSALTEEAHEYSKEIAITATRNCLFTEISPSI